MELHLGLGLAVSSTINKTTCCLDPDKPAFGSPSPHSNLLNHDQHHNLNKKRTFNQAFGNINASSVEVPQTLSLFSPDHHNSEEYSEDEHEYEYEYECESSSTINKRIDEGFEINSATGWPPIKPCRKKIWHSKSLYVKMKMEGVGIARKVDLSRYHSYQTLDNTLVEMFGKSKEDMKDYKLTYQDKEGDWLLAGDLPWKSFIRSVQCLKWIRNMD